MGTKIKRGESISSCDGMALVDKHKVKRQRLDRICEGETDSFAHLFLSLLSASYVHVDLRCWLHICHWKWII